MVDLFLHFVAHNAAIAFNTHSLNHAQQAPEATGETHLGESAVLPFHGAMPAGNCAALIHE
jgi:hypothetical protein